MLGALALLPALLAWLGAEREPLAVGRAAARARGPEPVLGADRRVLDASPGADRGLVQRRCSLALALPALRMEAVLPDARTLPAGSEVRRVDERLGESDRVRSERGVGGPGRRRARRARCSSPRPCGRCTPYLQRARAACRACSEVRTPLASLGSARPLRAGDREGRDRDRDRDAARAHRRTENLALVTAQGRHSVALDAEAGATVNAIRALPHPGLEVEVGGPTAMLVDIRSTLTSYGALVAAARGRLEPDRAVRRVPLGAGADQGRDHEPLSLARATACSCSVFQDGHLASLLALRAAGRHRGHHPADHGGGRVRPVDGLRGVPALPDPRGVPARTATTAAASRGPRVSRAASSRAPR